MAQLLGGPLDGEEYTDVPLGGLDSPPVLLFIPVPSLDGMTCLRAVYQREVFDFEPWTYTFVQINTVEPTPWVVPMKEHLPEGTSMTYSPEADMAKKLPPNLEPAMRFVIAQSWWIGSELCRRHSQLRLYEMHPGGGQYDVLRVFPLRSRRAPDDVVDMNRAGRIHLHLDAFQPVAWAEVLAADSPHDIVKRVEVARGWGSVGGADESTPTSVTYRLIAALLRARVDDRATWDVRMELVDSSGSYSDSNGFLDAFPLDGPSLVASAGDRLSLTGPKEHFWALLRDAEPLALFDDVGRVYARDGSTLDVFAVYKRRRKLQDVLTAVEERIT